MATVKTAQAGDDVICLICKEEIAGQYMQCFRRVNAHPLHLQCFEQFMASSLRKECPACKGAIPTLGQVRAAAAMDREATGSGSGAGTGQRDEALRDAVALMHQRRAERSHALNSVARSLLPLPQGGSSSSSARTSAVAPSASGSGWMTSRRRVSATPPQPPRAVTTLELDDSTTDNEEEEEEEELAEEPTSPAYSPTSPAYPVAAPPPLPRNTAPRTSAQPPVPPPLPLPPQAAPTVTSVARSTATALTSQSVLQRTRDQAAAAVDAALTTDLHDWMFDALPPSPARLREIIPTTTGDRFRQDVARSMRTLYVQFYNAVEYGEEMRRRMREAEEEVDNANVLVTALTRQVRELQEQVHARSSEARENRRRARGETDDFLPRTRPRM